MFCLEDKEVTASNTWFRYSRICSLFFDDVAISVDKIIKAVDQTVKALAET